jgi:hypothetical protein
VRWGVQSSLLFSLPGSVNASAYPIQAPFEEGREESQIELRIVIWALLYAVGGFSVLRFYFSIVIFFSVICAGPRGLFRISCPKLCYSLPLGPFSLCLRLNLDARYLLTR